LEQRAQPALSPALAEAQQRLVLLRQERRRERVALGLPLFTSEDGRAAFPLPSNSESVVAKLKKLPAHIGWESEPLSRWLRHTLARRAAADGQQPAFHPGDGPAPAEFQGGKSGAPLQKSAHVPETVSSTSPAGNKIKLYPDIALAMLRQEQSACGRVWLLLHHLDRQCCGWLSLEAARRQLSGPASPWRLCSGRQLRNLWHKGEGIFWQRDNGRIWLRGTARVAAALGVARLSQRPVALPVETLLQGVGIFRAHLYASFHSTRSNRNHHATRAKPVARATLQAISHVSPRSQRAYEERAGVLRQPNFAVATALRRDEKKERAWQHGRAMFSFTDQRGRQGKAGTVYLAWQLPNNYRGPHEPSSRGRQKRINQYLADLFMQGMTGNGRVAEENGRKSGRRFFGSGVMAAKTYSRTPQADLYWLDGRHANGRYTLWYLLPGQPKNQATTTGR
jgi:hypothetical protein